ncbi:hypothetical protein [Streptomyces poriticola]|uniref:hypothetical protein n=1 Tax=Streptomyces poriticola TaxID=3120506 RepID=UPI002FCE45AF
MSYGTTSSNAVLTAACAGAGCVRRESAGRARRLVVDGLRLCPACRERLFAELRQLPALYEECGKRLDISVARERERTSGGPLPGLPLNTAAVEARSATLSVLASWATVVAEGRGVTAPRRAVGQLAGFLLRHAGWLAAHEAVGDLSQETAQLVRGARRVIDPGTRRRMDIGACVEEGCRGRLTASVGPDRPNVPAEIACDVSPEHRWFGHQWLQLSRLLGARRGPSGVPAASADAAGGGLPAPVGVPRTRWFSAADVARLWNVPPGTVYRHASQQQWRRRTKQGRTYYHDADVHKTLSALRRTA